MSRVVQGVKTGRYALIWACLNSVSTVNIPVSFTKQSQDISFSQGNPLILDLVFAILIFLLAFLVGYILSHHHGRTTLASSTTRKNIQPTS